MPATTVTTPDEGEQQAALPGPGPDRVDELDDPGADEEGAEDHTEQQAPCEFTCVAAMACAHGGWPRGLSASPASLVGGVPLCRRLARRPRRAGLDGGARTVDCAVIFP
jgi:hypothetical protein